MDVQNLVCGHHGRGSICQQLASITQQNPRSNSCPDCFTRTLLFLKLWKLALSSTWLEDVIKHTVGSIEIYKRQRDLICLYIGFALILSLFPRALRRTAHCLLSLFFTWRGHCSNCYKIKFVRAVACAPSFTCAPHIPIRALQPRPRETLSEMSPANFTLL